MESLDKIIGWAFGFRFRQSTTYKCDILPVLLIKISTATDRTGTASVLGDGENYQTVHVYSRGNVSGLVGEGLGIRVKVHRLEKKEEKNKLRLKLCQAQVLLKLS